MFPGWIKLLIGTDFGAGVPAGMSLNPQLGDMKHLLTLALFIFLQSAILSAFWTGLPMMFFLTFWTFLADSGCRHLDLVSQFEATIVLTIPTGFQCNSNKGCLNSWLYVDLSNQHLQYDSLQIKKKQKQFLIAALVHRLCLQAHVSLFAFNTAHNINANYN